MTDPRPLRHVTTSDFDRALLDAARDDRAPDGAEEKALLALGIGAPATVSAAAGKIASLNPAAGATSKLATVGLLKWIVVVAMVGTASALLAHRATSKSAPTASAVVAPVMPSVIPEPPIAKPLEETPPVIAPVAQPTKSHSVSARPVPKTSSSSTTGGAANATLRAEVELLDKASKALVARDTASARASLEEYRRRFPNGSLAEEAELAGIDVLAQSGDRTGARDAALRFIDAHPRSAYEKRARAILKRVSNP